MNGRHYRIGIMFIWGLPLILFGFSEIASRKAIKVNGVIVSAEEKCKQPHNNRCVTTYHMKGTDGSVIIYRAESNDHSLDRNIPIGSEVIKEAGSIGYYVNGKYRLDFSKDIYTLMIGIGGLFFLQGFVLFPSIIATAFKHVRDLLN